MYTFYYLDLDYKFTIIDAPSILGLRPTGVQYLPEALKAAGIIENLKADYEGQIFAMSYDSKRDDKTFLLNWGVYKSIFV